MTACVIELKIRPVTEVLFKNNSSIGFGGDYYSVEPAVTGDRDFTGYRINIFYRKYFAQSPKEGLFFEPAIHYISTTVPEGDDPISPMTNGYRKGLGSSLGVGYQKLVLTDKLSLGAIISPAFYLNQFHKAYKNDKESNYCDPTFRIDFAITVGFCFDVTHSCPKC